MGFFTVKRCAKILLSGAVFSTSAFAAFIQKPIPPSAEKNFFLDANGDGFADQAEIIFLGNFSKESLDSSIKSISFYFPNQNGLDEKITIPAREILWDSSAANKLIFKIPQDKNLALQKTALSEKSKTAEILFTDSTTMSVKMKEKLPPKITSAILTAHEHGKDSLTIQFSEPVFVAGAVANSPAEIFEYKHENFTKPLTASLEWKADHFAAIAVWNHQEGFPASGDSLRILPRSLRDSSGNFNNNSFTKIFGKLPIQFRTNSLATILPSDTANRTPIFERIFSTSENHPNENELGIALEIGDEDFRHYLMETTKLPLDSIAANDLSISISFQIYTRAGEFVTAVHSKTNCADEHFSNGNCLREKQTFFLRWNALASTREAVATGVYLVRYSLLIRYQEKILWKNENSIATWGVKRISK